MKPLDQFEVWFFTGSQDLYGDETLRQVAANAERIVASLNEASAIPVRIVYRPVLKSPDGIAAAVPRGQCRGRLRRGDRLDAHLLAGADVDRWPAGTPEADAPPAYPVQPRSAVGRDRHGLHEPAPGGPRRPRVRVHRDPPGSRPQDRGGALAGPVRRRSDRRLEPRRLRLARGAPSAGRTLRRQHAPRRRHRGRQGRGADPVRRGGQRLSRASTCPMPSMPRRTTRSTSLRRPMATSTTWPPSSGRAATGDPTCSRRHGSRSGFGRS